MLQAYPGRGNPVLDALRGKISIRQLRVMLENLPPDNPAARDITGIPLSQEAMLLLDVSDIGRTQIAQTSNLYREKGKPAVKPELLPRPWEDDDDDGRTEEQIRAERDHLLAVLNRPTPE